MLTYVTTNEGKVREAREYLDGVERTAFDYPEIQAETLEPIAAQGARTAYRHLDRPVLVDDAGLFIETFGGFPGPYSAFVEDTVGVDGVWTLAEPEDDHRASFQCVIAYCDGAGFDASPDPVDREDRVAAAAGVDDASGTHPVKVFTGRVSGRLVPPRGSGGFGYDPIFEYDGQTFAEMTPAEKNAISHRGRALAKFAEWYADADRPA
ncbi:MAG: non-canonical purine NTP pyrophosphatase [Halobacteriaceae archaeon]